MRLIYDTSCKIEYYAPMDEKPMDETIDSPPYVKIYSSNINYVY